MFSSWMKSIRRMRSLPTSPARSSAKRVRIGPTSSLAVTTVKTTATMSESSSDACCANTGSSCNRITMPIAMSACGMSAIPRFLRTFAGAPARRMAQFAADSLPRIRNENTTAAMRLASMKCSKESSMPASVKKTAKMAGLKSENTESRTFSRERVKLVWISPSNKHARTGETPR